MLAFAAVHALAIALGYNFRESPTSLPWMWPASGTLLALLLLAPLRLWPALLLIQISVDGAFALAWRDPFLISWLVGAHTIEGVAGAAIVRALGGAHYAIGIRQVLALALGSGLGAALSGYLITLTALPVASPAGRLQDWQGLWAGSWLGALSIAPVLYAWLVPFRRRFQFLRLKRNLWEVPLAAAFVLGMTWWMFSVPAGARGVIAQVPVFLLFYLVIVAFRLPPRWALTISAASALLAIHLTANGFGPYSISSPASIMSWGQMRILLMSVVTALVAIFVTERAVAMERIETSEGRYRKFIELAAEAVWRIELKQPLPLHLPQDAQRAWFWSQARIAERNQAFERLDGGHASVPGDRPIAPTDHAWTLLLDQFLERIAAGAARSEGLRMTVQAEGRPRTYMVSFDGVIAEGRLERVWCLANDVSEIVDLNSRLLRDQGRIKSYAREITSADERARRATAVDLHDGIAQTLVAMGMMLQVLRDQAPPSAHALIGELRTNLRDVQERTRTMIADLSPPGLYELGLTPALQWLAVHCRSHCKLVVHLECNVTEDRLHIDLRVLVFKLIRELLRNVVKHAGVDRARVIVQEQGERILVEVSDGGRGFEWQMDLFGPRVGGFGLWSIADRVAEAGGEFNVNTAPGRGSRFDLSFPTRQRIAA